MKLISKLSLAFALIAGISTSANAQYWQLANQATDMISTALTAGMNYRGFFDVGYLAGIGNKNANIVDISTTHGVQISKTFYMGLGLGVNIMTTDATDNASYPPNSSISNRGFTTTGVAIPLYSDFRLNLGNNQAIGFFADLRLGASFLTGNKYIQVGDGYLTNSESFYLHPSVGMRVPLTQNGKSAFNISLTYQLTTSNYWYVSYNNITLNSLGVNVGLEW